MVTKERLEEMQDWFGAETNDPETEEWRYELTLEEAAIVERWDNAYEEGFANLVKALAAASKKRNATTKCGRDFYNGKENY